MGRVPMPELWGLTERGLEIVGDIRASAWREAAGRAIDEAEDRVLQEALYELAGMEGSELSCDGLDDMDVKERRAVLLAAVEDEVEFFYHDFGLDKKE